MPIMPKAGEQKVPHSASKEEEEQNPPEQNDYFTEADEAPDRSNTGAAAEDSFQLLASSIEIRTPHTSAHESFVSALTVASSTNDFSSQILMMPLDEREQECADDDGPAAEAGPTHSSKQSIGSMTMRLMMEELPPGMTSDEIDAVSKQDPQRDSTSEQNTSTDE